MCGAAPIPVSSGAPTGTAYTAAGPTGQQRPVAHPLVRLHCHQQTKDSVARRTRERKTKPEILRCLKRCVDREVYPLLH